MTAGTPDVVAIAAVVAALAAVGALVVSMIRSRKSLSEWFNEQDEPLPRGLRWLGRVGLVGAGMIWGAALSNGCWANDEGKAEVAESAREGGWIREVNAAVVAVERAGGEAEQAATGDGSWLWRSTACINAEGRVTQATVRVQDLTFGSRRPQFIPAQVGREVWQEVRGRLEEARDRASAACDSIEPQG